MEAALLDTTPWPGTKNFAQGILTEHPPYEMNNKSPVLRQSLNRSQYGGCSTGYNTLTSNQVVCKWSCAPTLNQSDPALATARDLPRAARPSNRAYAVTCATYLCLPTPGSRVIVTMSRRDSDLEAFSHNPSDGSFAALADRPTTWTKCLNLRFLSYWAGLLSQQPVNSRVKLTCLTTV